MLYPPKWDTTFAAIFPSPIILRERSKTFPIYFTMKKPISELMQIFANAIIEISKEIFFVNLANVTSL